MTLTEAAERGITHLRLPVWTLQEDHVVIVIDNGRAGPWMTLHSPLNAPITVPTWGDTRADWEEWLPPADP